MLRPRDRHTSVAPGLSLIKIDFRFIDHTGSCLVAILQTQIGWRAVSCLDPGLSTATLQGTTRHVTWSVQYRQQGQDCTMGVGSVSSVVWECHVCAVGRCCSALQYRTSTWLSTAHTRCPYTASLCVQKDILPRSCHITLLMDTRSTDKGAWVWPRGSTKGHSCPVGEKPSNLKGATFAAAWYEAPAATEQAVQPT